MGNGQVFGGGMSYCPSSHQPARIREETLEYGGNLFSGSWISAFAPYEAEIHFNMIDIPWYTYDIPWVLELVFGGI